MEYRRKKPGKGKKRKEIARKGRKERRRDTERSEEQGGKGDGRGRKYGSKREPFKEKGVGSNKERTRTKRKVT